MVRCDAIDGKPCKCQLNKPEVIYLLESIISNLLKLVTGAITFEQKEELRVLVQMPNAWIYLQFYLDGLDDHRNRVADAILDMVDL